MEVFLHIGLHKTGTGTLQRQYFPASEDLNLLTTLLPEMKTFVDLVTRKDPLYFDPEAARSVIAPLLSEHKPNMLSNESFSGPPYAGIAENGLDHRSPILTNLKMVFPDAKVILVLRRQDSLARSMYRQYLKSGGTRSIYQFYGMHKNGRPPLLSLDRFVYSPYVRALKASFSSGVLLLTFEQFVSDQPGFLRTLNEFLGIRRPKVSLTKENATKLGSFGMEATRVFNHLFRSHLNPAGLLPGIPVIRFAERRRASPIEILHDFWPGTGTLSETSAIYRISKTILDIAREDNEALDKAHNLGLRAFGYY